MIRLAIISAALLFSTPAKADTCGDIGKLAESIMSARQKEAPYSEVRGVAERFRYRSPEIYRLAIRIIGDAYAQPAYLTEQFRLQQISQFRNKWERLCYQVADEQEKSDFIGV